MAAMSQAKSLQEATHSVGPELEKAQSGHQKGKVWWLHKYVQSLVQQFSGSLYDLLIKSAEFVEAGGAWPQGHTDLSQGLWEETSLPIQITEGLFTNQKDTCVCVCFVRSLNLFSSSQRWKSPGFFYVNQRKRLSGPSYFFFTLTTIPTAPEAKRSGAWRKADLPKLTRFVLKAKHRGELASSRWSTVSRWLEILNQQFTSRMSLSYCCVWELLVTGWHGSFRPSGVFVHLTLVPGNLQLSILGSYTCN